MNYLVYFVSKGTGLRTVQIEALNQAGAKAQVEARYPGAYNMIPNQLPSFAKKKGDEEIMAGLFRFGIKAEVNNCRA